MDKKASIETYRKKRKYNKMLRRIIIFLIVAVFAGTGLILFRYADRLGLSAAGEQTSFPLSLSGYTAKSLRMCGDNLALLTDKNFSLFSKKGKTIQTENHGFSNPGIHCSSKRVLIYDISGTKFSVESKTGNIITKEMKNKILFGKIAENGNIVMVTEDSRYQCRVTVFDENGQETYRWYSAEKLVTGFDFTDSGTGCVISAFTTVEGLIRSDVYQLDFSKDKEVFTAEVGKSLAVAVSVKSNGNFHVITDTEITAYSSSGQVLTAYEFPKELLRYSEVKEGYTVVLLGDNSKSEKTVVVLDANGGKVGQTTIENNVDDLYTDGNSVIILTKDKIFSYSMDMVPGEKIDDQQLTEIIASKGDAVYTVSNSQVDRYSLSN